MTNSVTTTLAYLDTVIVAAFLGSAAVALVQAPLRLVPLLLYPALAIASTVAPTLTRSRPGQALEPAPFMTALRLLVVLHAAVVAVILVWAGPIVELLFGSAYAESADVLRALAPYVFFAGLAPLLAFSANYMGAAAGRLPIALAALAINLVADLLLIPVVGVVGAAVGLSLAFAVYVPAHLLALPARARLLASAAPADPRPRGPRSRGGLARAAGRRHLGTLRRRVDRRLPGRSRRLRGRARRHARALTHRRRARLRGVSPARCRVDAVSSALTGDRHGRRRGVSATSRLRPLSSRPQEQVSELVVAQGRSARRQPAVAAGRRCLRSRPSARGDSPTTAAHRSAGRRRAPRRDCGSPSVSEMKEARACGIAPALARPKGT